MTGTWSVRPNVDPRPSSPVTRAAPVSDLRTMVATLRRFDDRGPQRLALVGLLAFVTGASEAAVLALITTAAIAVTDAEGTQPLGPVRLSEGLALGLAAGLLLLNLASGFALAKASSQVAARSGLAARQQLLFAFHHATYERKSGHRVAALQERLTTHVDRFMNGFVSVTLLISAALSLASFAITALVINPLAVVALGVVGALILAVQRPMSVRTKRAARLLSAQRAHYAEGATESVLLAREMAVFGVDATAGDNLLVLDRRVAGHFGRTRFLNLMTVRIYQVLAFALVIGGLALVGGIGGSELTGIAAVALILLRSLSYGQALVGNLQSLSEYRPFVDQLTDLIDEYQAATRPHGTRAITDLETIDLHQVGFRYADAPVLVDVDLAFSAGETIGIVGPSGAGKTTLVNLLLRLYEPTEGSITVNGVPLADVDDDRWHQATALVPQEPRLLHGTIADNIRFLREIDDAGVGRAAQEANIADFVATLPEGIDSPVGELGQGLSGGQRQRICIARALAGQPELLVLDEPTSALDGESEAAIQATLQDLKGRVTMIIVAHRLSTLSICDRIVVVDGGRITAVGTPDDLRQSSKYFRDALAHAGL